MKKIILIIFLLATTMQAQSLLMEMSSKKASAVTIGTMYAISTDDYVRVASKLDDSTDLWVDIGVLGSSSNRLWNFREIAYKTNGNTTVNNELTTPTSVYKTFATDVIGPYSQWTGGTGKWIGGNHDHETFVDANNDPLPTARTLSTTVYFDDIFAGTNATSTNKVTIVTINGILDYGSIIDDSTYNGDEALREKITYTIQDNCIGVEVETIVKKAIDVVTYYGHQFSNNTGYTGTQSFYNSNNSTRLAFGTDTVYNRVTYPNYLGYDVLSNDGFQKLFGWIDYDYGLTNWDYLSTSLYNQITTTSSKTYNYLIRKGSGSNFSIGDTLKWRGGYYFNNNPSGSWDSYANYNYRGEEYLLVSYLGSGVDTINLDAGKLLDVESFDTTLTITNQNPLIISSDGYGVLKAKVTTSTLPYSISGLEASFDYRYGQTSNSGALSSIKDQTNSHDLLQASASLKPIIYAYGDTAGIHFDGTDDYLRINGTLADAFNPYNESFSIEFTFKGTDATASRLIGKYRSSSYPFWYISLNVTGTVSFSLKDTAGVNISGTTADVSVLDDAWHHIVCVADKNIDSLLIYIDGIKILASEQDISSLGTVYEASSSSYFEWNDGATTEWTSRSLNYYNKALSPSEVTALKNYYLR